MNVSSRFKGVLKVDEDPEDAIGGYDYRKTARFRQIIHFSITQVLFADHVH